MRTQIREDNWFNVTKGVTQSGMMYPLLFVLFIDSCMKKLRLGEEVTTVSYADDIGLV